ncbi:hypothetical protein BJ508DRAFT_412865 [Ascobolus immersus RN42]|uniref:F-box domain-containing protein n=1 Tax=Ascobolus immersus RN42 TaxID=1160509 RepID=A0A3N4IFA7_ASCIM|nr:hypothetical protein BJ508DRAFT_412865 [Ascobolus immersus RN42]
MSRQRPSGIREQLRNLACIRGLLRLVCRPSKSRISASKNVPALEQNTANGESSTEKAIVAASPVASLSPDKSPSTTSLPADAPVPTTSSSASAPLPIFSSPANRHPTASSPSECSLRNTLPSVFPRAVSPSTDSLPSTDKRQTPKTTLSLPPELLLTIFEWLDDSRDLVAIQKTSRTLRNLIVANSNTICRRIEVRRWSIEARAALDVIRESQAPWRVAMREVFQRALDTDNAGTYKFFVSRLQSSSDPMVSAFTRLVLLEKLSREIVKPWAEGMRCWHSRESGKRGPSAQEVERTEQAVYNVLRMTEFLHALQVSEEWEPFRFGPEGKFGFWSARSWNGPLWKCVIDIKGLVRKFSFKEHMGIVRIVLGLKKFSRSFNEFYLTELLLASLWDRSVNFRKMDQQEGLKAEKLMSSLVLGSLRDDMQEKIHQFSLRYVETFGWETGFNIGRYQVNSIAISSDRNESGVEDIEICVPELRSSVYDWCRDCGRRFLL